MSALVLVSCSLPAVEGPSVDLFAGPEVQPDATLPPPTVIHIDVRPVVDIRSDFDVTVSGLEPGEVVRVVTGSEPGVGPCHAMIGGYCMSMVRPLAVVGMPVADDSGVAVSTQPAPPWAGSSQCYQAVAVRGPAGIFTGLSDVVCVSYCDDDDGDMVCLGDDAFPADPSEWADADGDGTGDNSDYCPDDPDDLCAFDGLVQVAVSDDGEVRAECPEGTEIAFGFTMQTSSDMDGVACIKENTRACPVGETACETAFCDTPGDDETFAYLVCTPHPEAFASHEVVSVRADATAPAECPDGMVIGWGFKTQFSDNHGGDACLKANNGPCVVGETSCSTSACDTAGDDESMILLGCVPPDHRGWMLSHHNLVGDGEEITAICPDGLVTFGFSIHTVTGAVDPCVRDRNDLCPAGEASCTRAFCDSPEDDESQINVWCH